LLFRFAVYAEDQEPQYFEATFDKADVFSRSPILVEASPREAF
jgi:hypothetical protein